MHDTNRLGAWYKKICVYDTNRFGSMIQIDLGVRYK